jgi:hypothetical protein
MRKLLAVLLLLAVAGLITLFFVRRSSHDELMAGPRAASEASAPAAHAEPTESELATQPEAQAQREVVSPAAPATPVVAPEPNEAGATLLVRVIGKVDRAPLARVRLYIRPKVLDGAWSSDFADGSKGGLHSSPVTGSDGLGELDVPPDLEFVLTAEVEDGSAGGIEQDVAALKRGERREVVLELAQGNDGLVAGKVVAAESADPIAGARVALVGSSEGDPEPGASPSKEHAQPQATTGVDGAFEFRFPSWRPPHLRVEAEGYGLRLVPPSRDWKPGASALLVKLSRSGTLDARVLDSAGKGIAGAWVHLSAHGYELSNSREDEERGFFGGEYFSLPDEQWKCQTTADGAARIAGLPAGVGFVVEVRKDDKVLQHEASELTLAAGETREIEWRIGAGTRLSGLVLDQDNALVKGQLIWLQKCMVEVPTYFQKHEDERIVKHAQTDAQGRFVIEDVPAGKWWIGPAAERNEWDEPKPDGVAPCAQVIATAGEPALETTLHVFRGLYIRGKVVDPAGAPVNQCYVHGESEGTMVWYATQSKEDGTFAFGPITAGSFALTANSSGSFASSEPVRARSGDADVVLRLKPGATIRGHVVDAATGAGCQAQLMFVPEHPGEGMFGNGMSTSSDPDGSFRHAGFDPGRYGITAMTTDGRFAQQAGVDVGAGAESGDIVLALKPGGKLRLVYKGAKPSLFVGISCGGVPIGFGDSLEAGKPKVQLAPAGSLVLELRAEYNAPARTKTLELQPGETKEITLTDED